MQHRLIKRGGVKLLVLLPSAIKRADPPNPYYARISWHASLPIQYDCLYLSDPYFNETRPFGGSWFIHSLNNKVGLDIIKECISKYQDNYESVTVYGSSMGGYAALALSNNAYNRIIVECPQIYLDRYPDSANYLKSVSLDVDKTYNISEILCSNTNNCHIDIYVNVSDHHHIDAHILPFYSAISRAKRPNLHIIDYGQVGHVAMSKEMLCSLL
ncbi:MAG: hypothetical protein N2B59_04280 [Psychrobacter sp.]